MSLSCLFNDALIIDSWTQDCRQVELDNEKNVSFNEIYQEFEQLKHELKLLQDYNIALKNQLADVTIINNKIMQENDNYKTKLYNVIEENKKLCEYKKQVEHRNNIAACVKAKEKHPILLYTYNDRCIKIKIIQTESDCVDRKILDIDNNEIITIVCKSAPPKNMLAPIIIHTANDMLRYLICNYIQIRDMIQENNRIFLYRIVWETFFHLIKQQNIIYLNNNCGRCLRININDNKNSKYKAFIEKTIKMVHMSSNEILKLIKYMLIIWGTYNEFDFRFEPDIEFNHGQYAVKNIKMLPFDIDQDLFDMMIDIF
jgi:hypothetical protein